jgi:beta-alanine degradation protein BauB
MADLSVEVIRVIYWKTALTTGSAAWYPPRRNTSPGALPMARHRTVVFTCLLSFLTGAGAMAARQQVQSATRREPQFENEHLKVWKSIIMPKQPLALHRHEHGRALVALVGGRLTVVDSSGTALNTYDWESGKAYWLAADPPGQLHADVNNTDKPIEVIVVELKKDR